MTHAQKDAFFATLPSNALYALCDQALLERNALSLRQFVILARTYNAVIIQYRYKHGRLDQVREQLKALRALWDGVLIVNDFVALASECDGVHIGQSDLMLYAETPLAAAHAVRMKIGEDAIFGLSTRNSDEIVLANTMPVDYIGLGAYRVTGTKSNTVMLGNALDMLAATSEIPVAAIGGVTFDDRFDYAAMRVMGSALMNAVV